VCSSDLAEYAYGNYPQGFSHIMNNLNIYHYWGKGFVEEVMNGATYEPSGVCPHQCWSETMVIQPAIEGMLGLTMEDQSDKVVLTPHFPANWDSANVENIRTGNKVFDMKMKRTDKSYYFTFHVKRPGSIEIEFSPTFPAGTKFLKVQRDGKDIFITSFGDPKNTSVLMNLAIEGKTEIRIDYDKGIDVLPVIADPRPGSAPEGLRILSNRLGGDTYHLMLEDKSNTSGNFFIYLHNQIIDKIENASIVNQKGDLFELMTDFSTSGGKYSQKEVLITLGQKKDSSSSDKDQKNKRTK
jgi:hypothetical protein